MRPQWFGQPPGESRLSSGRGLHGTANLVHQQSRKEEMRLNHNQRSPSPSSPRQTLRQRGTRHGQMAHLAPRYRSPPGAESNQPGKFGLSLRIPAAPPDKHQADVVRTKPPFTRDRFVKTPGRQLDNVRVAPEMGQWNGLDARMSGQSAGHLPRNVVPHMAGRKQHERSHGHARRPRFSEPGQPLGDGRPDAFQKGHLHSHEGECNPDELGQFEKRATPLGVGCAMAYQKDAEPAMGFREQRWRESVCHETVSRSVGQPQGVRRRSPGVLLAIVRCAPSR